MQTYPKALFQAAAVLAVLVSMSWGYAEVLPSLKIETWRDKLDEKTWQASQERLAAEALRSDALIWPGDRDMLDVVLRRTRALLDDIADRLPAGRLKKETGQLSRLENLNKSTALTDPARLDVYKDACRLRREIALANPLLDFDRIVFLKHHRALYEHMVDQFYGFHAKPGGGVFVIEDPFGDKPVVKDLLADAVVGNGRLKGQKLAGGSFISLELSFDAKTILLAWTQAERTVDKWSPESTYHIFRADIDGTNLVQLTDGGWNDFDPCFLPDGRIVFVSERRGGYLRCSGAGGRPNPTYAMHVMNGDGGDIRMLSYHETHEWQPSVDNNGMIAYTRWDYVDRDSDIAHHIWLTTPDGRDPRSYHGNYPDARELRPWMEMSIRAIEDSHRYVAVSAPHHGQNYGSLVLIDQRCDDEHHEQDQ